MVKQDRFDVHHYVRIESLCANKSVWVDDGFNQKIPKYVHDTPPDLVDYTDRRENPSAFDCQDWWPTIYTSQPTW